MRLKVGERRRTAEQIDASPPADLPVAIGQSQQGNTSKSQSNAGRAKRTARRNSRASVIRPERPGGSAGKDMGNHLQSASRLRFAIPSTERQTGLGRYFGRRDRLGLRHVNERRYDLRLRRFLLQFRHRNPGEHLVDFLRIEFLVHQERLSQAVEFVSIRTDQFAGAFECFREDAVHFLVDDRAVPSLKFRCS